VEQYRHIDTTGLPKGFDIADLVESGVTGQALIDWCKARVRPGPPVVTADEKPPVTRKVTAKPKAKPVPSSQKSNVIPIPDPEAEVGLDIPPEFSEDSLADEYTRRFHKTLLFCKSWETWLHWEDNRWKADETALSLDLSRRVCRETSLLALDREELGSKARTIANTLSSRRCIAAVEGIARSDRRHVVRPSEFDADAWALNTPIGVVDLKTGDIRPAKRSDRMMKSASVGPGGNCPTWLRFMQDCTEGDAELIGYLKRIAGYCLTGSISEQKFFFIYGCGGNGKGTYLNMLMYLLNTYGRQANMDTFTEQRFTKHASEIAFFQGARMVVASETNVGQKWNEARIKGMTGGDPITAQFMHKNPFTFAPTFKLIFNGNHKPHLKNVDAAIKRRLYLIPFDYEVPDDKVDGQLPEKLAAEASGILSWCIEGCLEWQAKRLKPPARVIATTAEYFEREDKIGGFLAECCELSNAHKVTTSLLFERYTRWADEQGEYIGSRRVFLDMLAVKGYRSVKVGGEQIVAGVRLSYDSPSTPPKSYSF